MSERVSLAPQAADTRRPRGGESDAVVVPINESIPQHPRPPHGEPADAKTATADPKPIGTAQNVVAPPVATAPGPRRGGRWFPAFCALLALMAAAVALAAPALRPEIAATTDAWLGQNNAVSRLLVPPPSLEPAWHLARDEAMQAVNAQLGDFNARIDRLVAAQQAATADLARAVADLRSDHAAGESLARAVDALSRQTRDLGSATAALDGRIRATGLLTLSLRLRRDIDAGLPIGRDVAALMAAGPYPGPIDSALQQLRYVNDGAPTMRDLADEFDRVLARFAARADAGSSWASRGWTRVASLFGGPVAAGDTTFAWHLRALATDGRFSEAADEIAASSDADLGADWVARVRARAAAVISTQALMAYSLAAYENAFAASGANAGGQRTQ
jgi:hypothetical protein